MKTKTPKNPFTPRNLVQLELILTRKGRHSRRYEKRPKDGGRGRVRED